MAPRAPPIVPPMRTRHKKPANFFIKKTQYQINKRCTRFLFSSLLFIHLAITILISSNSLIDFNLNENAFATTNSDQELVDVPKHLPSSTLSTDDGESSYFNRSETASIESNSELWTYFGCDTVFESERPIHSENIWINARELYRKKFSGKDSASMLNELNSSGFSVSIEVKTNLEKGRGIFAAEDIKKGDLIWSGKNSAWFHTNGVGYKKFIASLEPNFVCDALLCSYVQDFDIGDNSTELRIVVDLDEGCFVNSDSSEGNDKNMGCDPEVAESFSRSCKWNDFFALRDITAGEELICMYGDFVKAWKSFSVD